MNDSLSLDNLTLQAGPTDLGKPKDRPIAPAPDDPPQVSVASEPANPLGSFSIGGLPGVIATETEIAAPEMEPAPSPCRTLGHSWKRNPTESGTGQPGLADRHYTCNRVGCGASQAIRWDRGSERWVAAVALVREAVHG